MNDDDLLREGLVKWQLRLDEGRRACLMADESEFPEAVCTFLYSLRSEQRASEMVSLLERASPEAVWKVFLTHWPNCDDTWTLKDRLLNLLRKAAGGANANSYCGNEQRAFFESLPQVVTVYRGCSRPKTGGISWTTEIEIAKQFARGHRQLSVPEPVIVTAEIDKDDILAVFTNRSEKEIICTPSRILKIENLINVARLFE